MVKNYTKKINVTHRYPIFDRLIWIVLDYHFTIAVARMAALNLLNWPIWIFLLHPQLTFITGESTIGALLGTFHLTLMTSFYLSWRHSPVFHVPSSLIINTATKLFPLNECDSPFYKNSEAEIGPMKAHCMVYQSLIFTNRLAHSTDVKDAYASNRCKTACYLRGAPVSLTDWSVHKPCKTALLSSITARLQNMSSLHMPPLVIFFALISETKRTSSSFGTVV